MKKLVITLILFTTPFATSKESAKFEFNGQSIELSPLGKSIVEELNELTEISKSNNKNKESREIPKALMALLGANHAEGSVDNQMKPQLEEDCLIFGEGSFCKRSGLAHSLTQLEPIEYNALLTKYIFPRYMQDLQFQMSMDRLFSIHNLLMEEQLKSERVQMTTGGKIVDGALTGFLFFSSAKGVQYLFKKRKEIATSVMNFGKRKRVSNLPAPRGGSTAMVKYSSSSFWKSRKGLAIQIAGAAVIGATCRTVDSCGLDPLYYRADALLALQYIQTEMACNSAELANTYSAMNFSDDSKEEMSIHRKAINELIDQIAYLLISHEHVQNFQRNPNDPNHSFQNQTDDLMKADEWFVFLKDQCPSVNLSESLYSLTELSEQLESQASKEVTP